MGGDGGVFEREKGSTAIAPRAAVPDSAKAALGVVVIPAATHSEVLWQETSSNFASVRGVGLAVVWVVQELPSTAPPASPFRRPSSPRVLRTPTAVQAVALVQEMLCSTSYFLPSRLVLVCTDQLLPFQDSARVRSSLLALTYLPTAMQAVDEVQETPRREVESVTPLGLGTLWIDQALPFQDSANGVVLRVSVLR